jgi:probable F420-dependent oxidoreductase
MKIGLFSTFMSPIADAAMIEAFAQRAEAIGVDSLWMGEHVVLFETTELPYPGSRDGKIPVPAGGGLLDPVATFGFLAGVTDKLRLGTGVTLISQRNPLYTAKEFATLDWLTGGRIDLGVGVGWCKVVVIASGYGWRDRGRRADEFLEVLSARWSRPGVSHQGGVFRFPPCHLDPKPVQQPHMPIYVGGHSTAALRRAARYGQGWYGFQLTPEQTRPILERLRAEVEAAGRSWDELTIAVTPPNADAGTVAEFAAIGVGRLILHLGSQRPDAVDARLDEVAALIAAVGS